MNRRTLILIVSLVLAMAAAGAEKRIPDLKPRVNTNPPFGGAWTSQGPAPTQGGDVEGITNNEVSGAINTVVADPSNAGTLWIGTVNGGIWKTANATSASPTWTPKTDGASSLSISALVLDPSLPNTLVAGTGGTSSFSSTGGLQGRLFRTTNGGDAWSELTATGLANLNLAITGIVARGNVIVAAVSNSLTGPCTGGMLRSTDTGANFSAVTSGLPTSYAVWYLTASSPSDNNVLYAAIHDCGSGNSGIYKSTDTGSDLGKTWSRVGASDLTDVANASSSKIAVGGGGEVYVGIIVGGQLSSLFRSGDHGTTWQKLDTPTTTETDVSQPQGINPGAQGNRNFSIVADPVNRYLVYVGGDRQPGFGQYGIGLPNAIGAYAFDGRLFRVDASLATGSQATPLTHCPDATAACNNTISTSNRSAPHADSRSMTFDANNELLETDDGGIYRRTSPRATGDWYSINGNLQVAEVHDVAYDHISKKIIAGAQDTGTPYQHLGANNTLIWSDFDDADGGDVGVDEVSLSGGSSPQSFRYSSKQALGDFAKETVNHDGTVVTWLWPTGLEQFWYPANAPNPAPARAGARFLTPVEVNRVAPAQLLFALQGDLWESFNRGDGVTALQSGITATAMVYGGREGGTDYPNVIWCVSGATVYVRTPCSSDPSVTCPLPSTAAPAGSRPKTDIAIDTNEWRTAFVIDDQSVYYTTDTGAHWTDITGNLPGGGLPTSHLRTIVFIPGNPAAIAVGGDSGVFRMALNDVSNWSPLGTNLPNAIVMDLDYDATDGVLTAGTFGRGVWTLANLGGGGDTPPAAPTSVTATAISNRSIRVSWTGSVGASTYTAYRTDTVNGTYVPVCSSSSSSCTDDLVGDGISYLYKVRAVSDGGTESADSNIDLATTVVPTDDPPTTILADDIILLRKAVTAVRALVPTLGGYTFTDSDAVLRTHSPVRGIHVQQLREALQQAWTALTAALPTLTVPDLSFGLNVDPAQNGGHHYPVLRTDITKLRQGVGQ